jgi:hypothetical protein
VVQREHTYEIELMGWLWPETMGWVWRWSKRKSKKRTSMFFCSIWVGLDFGEKEEEGRKEVADPP